MKVENDMQLKHLHVQKVWEGTVQRVERGKEKRLLERGECNSIEAAVLCDVERHVVVQLAII